MTVKLLYFPYTCLHFLKLASAERKITIILSWQTSNGKSVSRYMFHIQLFLTHYSVTNKQKSMKRISTVNYWKYWMFDHQRAHPSYRYKRWMCRCITLLHFQLLQTLLAPFQAKSSTINTPDCNETVARIPPIITNAAGERNGTQRKTNVSFGIPWCKHWSCCSWQKGTSREKVMINSQEIKPVAITIIKICLSEGIS